MGLISRIEKLFLNLCCQKKSLWIVEFFQLKTLHQRVNLTMKAHIIRLQLIIRVLHLTMLQLAVIRVAITNPPIVQGNTWPNNMLVNLFQELTSLRVP